MATLSTTYMGFQISSPIVIASCGLTNSLNEVIELEKNGAGAVVLKSLFEEEIITELQKEVHAMKTDNYHLYPETMKFFEESDVEDTLTSYLKLITECKAAVKIPIIASINCITSRNWTYFAKTLKNAGADGLELNISLFPTDDDRSSAEIEQIYIDIIKAVKKEVDIPLSVKIGPFFTNLSTLATRLSLSGVRSITLFNKQYSADIDIDELSIVDSTRLSSSTDYTLPLRWCAILSNRINCEISTSTGVHNGETAIKMLLAGAQTIQIATTLYKNGLEQVKAINNEIVKWMDAKKFGTIDDFRGKLSVEETIDPSAYLRIQFMKNYSEK